MRKKWIVLLSLLLVVVLSLPVSAAIADDPPSPTDTVTLHVLKLWDETPVQYVLTYDANGGTGAPASQTAFKDTTIGISDTVPVWDTYVFSGWSEQSNAASPEYQPGDAILMNSNKTLYAVWQEARPTTYTVTYHTNYREPGSIPAFYVDEVTAGSMYTILHGTNDLGYVQTYFTFDNWNVRPNGMGTRYYDGATIEITGDLILYAIWSPRI